jgi:nucleoside-diphosphate-sugar epimerase
MSAQVLVTGSNGFIGSHLVERLLEKGSSLKCMVRRTSNLKWISGYPYKCVYADFRDPDSLREAVSGVDEIYHLGGTVRVVDNKTYYETNSRGTQNLAEAVEKYNPGIRKFVYVSSQAAWGPKDNGPVSHYGMSKAEGEKWARKLRNCSIVRPVAVYGPRDRDFLSVFKMAQKGFFLKPREAGLLSFIHVADCVDGIINAKPGEESFLSDGFSYTWKEVIGTLEKVFENNIKSINIPANLVRFMGWVGTVFGKIKGSPVALNSDKVREILAGDWVVPGTAVKAKYNLETGFEHTYRWYVESGWL